MKNTTTKPLTISCTELEEGIDLDIIFIDGRMVGRSWDYEGDYIEPELVAIKREQDDIDPDMILRFFDIEQLLDEREIVVNEQMFGEIKDLI